MRVYLAGPMSICPKDFNFPAFFAAAEYLRRQGFEVFNPAEEDLKTWGCLDAVKKYANYRDCLKKDLLYLLDHADAMYVLPGWEASKGVAVELALAKALGLKIEFLPNNKEFCPSNALL